MATSPFFRDLILEHTILNPDIVNSRPWISLHTEDPGETGANEILSDEYGRQRVEMVRIAPGTMTNSQPIEFPTLPEARISYFGCWIEETGGVFLLGGPIVGFRVLAGQAARWREGEMVIRVG